MACLYLAKQVGIAGAFALWAYIVAKGLFARSSLRLSFVQEVALLVPAGFGVAILLLFGLGIAGALTGPGILAGGGVVLALACGGSRACALTVPSCWSSSSRGSFRGLSGSSITPMHPGPW